MFFLCLFVCLFDKYSQPIGHKGPKFSLLVNSSQTNGLKWFKSLGFDGAHPGMVIRTFGADWLVQ